MGETCFHMPARVFGFESSAAEAAQPTRQASAPSAPSLLSRLLKDGSSQMPVAYMDASDAYSDDSDDDMEEGDCDEETEEDGSIPIPPTSESWLKQQREAHARFVYAVQIEEMRQQCAAYFSRMQRVGAMSTGNDSVNNVNTNATTSSASETKPQQNSRPAQPGPGF